MPPSNVKEVVANSEESDGLEGDDGAQVGGKLEGKSISVLAIRLCPS